MSTGTRDRPRRQAAATVTYAEANASSDSDEEEAPKPRPTKRPRVKKGAKKGDNHEESNKEEEATTPGAYLWQPVPHGVLHHSSTNRNEMVERKVTRIDFTALLPVEVLLEICSHLRIRSLWHLAFVNKRFHAALTSDSGAAMWRYKLETPPPQHGSTFKRRPFAVCDSDEDDYDEAGPNGQQDGAADREERRKAREERRLPTDGGKPINPLKLAALCFLDKCQYCGVKNAPAEYDLLARICQSCFDREAVSLSSLASCDDDEDGDLDRLHPMTAEIVRTTELCPSGLKPKQRKPPYALTSDLKATSEHLEELQMQDDAEKALTKGGRRGGRASRSGPTAASQGTTSKDDEQPDAYSHLTPRVREFVRQRVARQAERREIGLWLSKYAAYAMPRNSSFRPEELEREVYENDLFTERRRRIVERINKEGVFASFANPETTVGGFVGHPLVRVAEPLTDEVWLDVRPRLYKDLGRCVAHNILVQHKARDVKSTKFAWDRVMPALLARPPELSDNVWKYVEPQISALVEEEKQHAQQLATDKVKADAARKHAALREAKQQFFRDRLNEIREKQSDERARDYLPRLADFCMLQVVRDFYDDPTFAIKSENKSADLKKWEERLDESQAAIDEYKIDVRLSALKVILAATTDRSEEEIESLDVEELARPAYDDDFFLRPSSWVHCSSCLWMYGPLAEILRHRQVAHSSLGLRAPAGLSSEPEAGKEVPASSADPGKPPVELSLEIACTMLSICEIGQLDADDPNVTRTTLNDEFHEIRFRWKNADLCRTSRHTWSDLIRTVHQSASSAHKLGEVLPVPEIRRTTLSPYERRRRWQQEFYERMRARTAEKDVELQAERAKEDEHAEDEGKEEEEEEEKEVKIEEEEDGGNAMIVDSDDDDE
ncbi:hypothetical protein JCM10908_002581 [Rhodotorula pacifica]|uniref:uncharacterized protein n=1 Tax=Rhodotorula pacifica TaxID=1495444 RepID=UPI00317D3959